MSNLRVRPKASQEMMKQKWRFVKNSPAGCRKSTGPRDGTAVFPSPENAVDAQTRFFNTQLRE